MKLLTNVNSEWVSSNTISDSRIIGFGFLLIQLHMLLTCCPVGEHGCYLWEMLSSPVQFWILLGPSSNEFHMVQMNCIPRKWFNISGNGAIKLDFPAWPDGFTVTSHYFSLLTELKNLTNNFHMIRAFFIYFFLNNTPPQPTIPKASYMLFLYSLRYQHSPQSDFSLCF